MSGGLFDSLKSVEPKKKMTPQRRQQMLEQLQACNTLNKKWQVLNAYYDLDKEYGSITGKLAANKIAEYMDVISNVLKIPVK